MFMNRSLSFALALVLATAVSAAAQAMAPEEDASARALVLSLGPLATGSVSQGTTVGHIGLFSSDLSRILASSPEAARYAQVFSRDSHIGRPLVLVGVGLVVGGLAAYVTRHGQLGMGGREIAAFGVGGVAMMYGADRLSASRRALRSAVDEYNRTSAER